ncbi:MAG TPA: hypothetical protein VFI52_03035 [Gemmatimonadaceae bacterium]|nr:hypothetical protein [Gemmatimonadaceae bacterium]
MSLLMTAPRTRVWWGVAVLFTLINLAGGVWAFMVGEPVHCGIHAGLTVLGAYLTFRLAPRRVDSY